MGCGTSKWDSARGRSAGPGTASVVKRASSAPAVTLGVERAGGVSDETHTITRATSNPEAPTRVAGAGGAPCGSASSPALCGDLQGDAEQSVDSIHITSDQVVTVDAAAVGTES